MVTTTTTLEVEVSFLKKKMVEIEKKLDYLISLLEEDEDFTPEEIEELRRRIERIDRGEVKTYPAEEVLKKLGLDVS